MREEMQHALKDAATPLFKLSERVKLCVCDKSCEKIKDDIQAGFNSVYIIYSRHMSEYETIINELRKENEELRSKRNVITNI